MLYEQQVALVGNNLGNISLVKYVVPAILYNRAGNIVCFSDEDCIQTKLILLSK